MSNGTAPALAQLRNLPEHNIDVVQGSAARIHVYITNQALTPVDPEGVTLRILDPAEVETVIEKADLSELTTGGAEPTAIAGSWYTDITLDQAGTWHVRLEVTGDYEDVDERSFSVRPSRFDLTPPG